MQKYAAVEQIDLKAVIERKYGRCWEIVAKDIHMSIKRFKAKLDGLEEFTYTEVLLICCVLDIKNPLEVFKPNFDNYDRKRR